MGTCFSSDAVTFKDVCKKDELVVGEPKEIKLGDKLPTCLVIKDENGEVHALSAKCTHYGASLTKGAYSNGLIRCPWHGACFNVKTGDIEDFPGLDSLHKFEVDVTSEGLVRINTGDKSLTGKRSRAMGKRNPENKQVIVIVGGGAAAQEAAETLRQDNLFDGKIILISNENSLPYDRPKLSKALVMTGSELALRPPGFYDTADIEVMLGTEVTEVNTNSREVTVSGGDKIVFDKLILATGSTPRKLNVDGGDLKNIFTLRTSEDANSIAKKGKDKSVVIVGTSFIGMEVAAFFSDHASAVTLIGNGSVPFEKSLGAEVGGYLMKLHEDKGVKFLMNEGVKSFIGNEENNVEKVELQSGNTIDADIVVLGIGVTPNTTFLKATSLDISQNGFLRVNNRLETNIEGIFAAGDIALFPLSSAGNEEVSIGHWQLAMKHGRTAALNAGGSETPLQTVPFFWTQQYGKSIRYAGYSSGFENIVIDGSVEEGEFVAYYCKGGDVVAVATLMRDPIAAEFASLLSSGKMLSMGEVKSQWRDKILDLS